MLPVLSICPNLSVVIPLVEASDDEIQRLRNYGRAVGVLYQLVEDILEAKKDGGDDEMKGKRYGSVYGVEEAMKVVEDFSFVLLYMRFPSAIAQILAASYCHGLDTVAKISVSEKRGRLIDVMHLEELLSGCTHLETLILMFDVSIFLRHNFARVWSLAPPSLIALEIGYISSVMVIELLTPCVGPQQQPNHPVPSTLPNIQKLCLSVDYITDTMISTISKYLTSLTHLDLRDAPIMEPRMAFDLTNKGLQQINARGKLKHLCLVRSQEIAPAYFKRVNDLGILLMANKFSDMESICLGGFCQVTKQFFTPARNYISSEYFKGPT